MYGFDIDPKDHAIEFAQWLLDHVYMEDCGNFYYLSIKTEVPISIDELYEMFLKER